MVVLYFIQRVSIINCLSSISPLHGLMYSVNCEFLLFLELICQKQSGLRLEQKYGDSSPTLDVPLKAKQLKDLLQRNTGGIGLVDNHFYIVGPLPRIGPAPGALSRPPLAEQIIQDEEITMYQKRRRKLGGPIPGGI